jgi:hypothetical protein
VLVVDLDGLTFLGSRGLSALVEINAAAGRRDARCRRKPSGAPGDRDHCPDHVLTICATVDEAVGMDT